MIRGAIFDVDGTLLDSMGIWEVAGVRYLENIQVEPEPGLSKIQRLLLQRGTGKKRCDRVS